MVFIKKEFKFFLLLFVFCSLFIINKSFAQLNTPYEINDSNYYLVKDRPALKNFLYHLSYFPPLPRNKFEIGIHSGLVHISGDVTPTTTPLGVDITVRKSLGYVFSLRGQYIFGIATGQNTLLSSPSNTTLYNTYIQNGQTSILRNYKTTINQLNLQVLINLTNIDFSKLEKKYNVYLLTGVGYMFYDTKIDAYKGQNERYNFEQIVANGGSGFDGDYESSPQNNTNSKPQAITFSGGLGFQYKLSDFINLQIENQVMATSTIFLDGSYDIMGSRSVFENNFVNYLSVGINFNIGPKKSVAPLYWLNPLIYLYKEINSPRALKIPQPKLNDTDEDGVADLFDKEPSTLPGVPVDSKGVTLDTDGDGIPDYRDDELITPTYCQPVNNKGVGKCLTNDVTNNNYSCCQSVINELDDLKKKINKNAPTSVDTIYKDSNIVKQKVDTNFKINTLNNDCYHSNLVNSLSEKIVFYYNTSELISASYNPLDNIIELIKRNRNFVLIIQGNFKSFENLDSSEQLFVKRRNVLGDYLYSNGVLESQIKFRNIEDYDKNSSFLSLENSNCVLLNIKNCPELISTPKYDNRYFNAYYKIQPVLQKIKYKKEEIIPTKFDVNYLDSVVNVLEFNKDYYLLISAPYKESLFDKNLKLETKLSFNRGEYLKKLLIDKNINPTQIQNVPINSSQEIGAIPMFRILQNENIDSDNDCVKDIIDRCPLTKGDKKFYGCLSSPDIIDSIANIAKNILFDFDKDNLKESSFQHLKTLSNIIIKNKYFITIYGKTDDIGNDEHNLNLSYRRAISVKNYLKTIGVPDKLMQAVGLGAQKSLVGTEEERAYNRRVDIWLNGLD